MDIMDLDVVDEFCVRILTINNKHLFTVPHRNFGFDGQGDILLLDVYTLYSNSGLVGPVMVCLALYDQYQGRVF